MVEVRVNATKEKSRMWKPGNSHNAADTWEQDEAKQTVCCGGHVVSTQVGRSVTTKGAQITANSTVAVPENNSALGVISSSV